MSKVELSFPEWIYTGDPKQFVEWLDEVHGLKLDHTKIDTEAVQRIAQARKRDGTLGTVAMFGEHNTIDRSVVHIMTEAAQDGTHHLTEGEYSSPLEWFMSKVEAGDWSEGMRYELQGVMNVVIPAFRAIGLNQKEIMEITKNPTKARAVVTHMRPLYEEIQKKHDDYTAATIENIYHDTVDDNISTVQLKNKLNKVVVPDPVVVEEAWTDEQSSIMAIYFTDDVQRRAFNLIMRKFPHDKFTTDLVTMAGNVIGNYKGDIP